METGEGGSSAAVARGGGAGGVKAASSEQTEGDCEAGGPTQLLSRFSPHQPLNTPDSQAHRLRAARRRSHLASK